MNLKAKVLGLAAVAAMSIGFAGNVSAEDTEAELEPNPSGVCSAAVGGGNVDFGIYVFNGTTYDALGTTLFCGQRDADDVA